MTKTNFCLFSQIYLRSSQRHGEYGLTAGATQQKYALIFGAPLDIVQFEVAGRALKNMPFGLFSSLFSFSLY
jgi:hypothetical protein